MARHPSLVIFLPPIASHAGENKELAMPRFEDFEPRGMTPATPPAFNDEISIDEAL